MNKKNVLLSLFVIVVMLAGYQYLDALLFSGIKPLKIKDQNFTANFYAKENIKNKAVIILIGGGNWGNYWSQEFAKANYVGLSLPYHRLEGLPALMEEIPLDYFEKAIDWLKKQPEVNSNKIIVMGASRNAELALLVASYYPETVHGAIAFSPSSVSWSNTVLPYNSDTLKPSWIFKNDEVPFIPMEKIKGGFSDAIETLPYWKQGLLDTIAVQKASIPVENIKGPILLLSGLDDAVWPSAMMSDLIENRIKNNAFEFDFENIKYKNACHLISGNPNQSSSIRQGEMWIDGKNYAFNFGGSNEGDAMARKDAFTRIFQFLSKL